MPTEPHRTLTLVVPDFRTPAPGRDELVGALRAHFPAAVVSGHVSSFGTGPLAVHGSGPTARELHAAARLYLGWLGIRFALRRTAPRGTRSLPAA